MPPSAIDRPTFRSFILCIHTVFLQASVIIRQLGLVPTSNKVSSDINFENLIFGKRKPRIVRSRHATQAFPPAPRAVLRTWDPVLFLILGSGIRNEHPG
jgi:hypothetical protein